ncbi:uncharacterized protein LOC123924531 [Trifolium pratense]|uniref:Uncharacterized protein n=1 Tax=Trifolium pratense TaxID=57577 RepID=A0ACB0KJ54_TRIPR|nr:uncharacterized protein LOC123924531 [Trifolium pratense]CAJ2655930.1 unnamed protein product [Trifolium pratense]
MLSVDSKKPLLKRTKISLINPKHARRILAKRKFFARLRLTRLKRYIQRRNIENERLRINDEEIHSLNVQIEAELWERFKQHLKEEIRNRVRQLFYRNHPVMFAFLVAQIFQQENEDGEKDEEEEENEDEDEDKDEEK